MFALSVLSASTFLAILFLVYCFLGFSRASGKRRRASSLLSKYHSPVTQLLDSDRDNGDPKWFYDRTRITKALVAGLSLAMPTTLAAQTSPVSNTATPAPLAAPAMVGPLIAASPRTFDAGLLGKLDVTGTLTGFGTLEDHSSQGGRAARADISNAQVFIQRTSGFVQYYFQAGAYNIPALGTPSISTRNTISDFFGPLPQAYLKLAPKSSFSFLICKLPTLIGAENTFTFENLNIERGLLWNQENSVNRGMQVNYNRGKFAGSLSWNDGYYSNRYNWLTGALTYTANSANNVEFVAGGNLGQTGYSNAATPLYQNNGSIYDLIYTHTAKRWMIEPYLQYTYVPQSARVAVGHATSTFGASVLGNYTLTSLVSLTGRAEYLASSGNIRNGVVNLLYGPGSDAWSLTLTPTYQNKAFFARGEFSFIQAINSTSGDAFGANGRNSTQARGGIETGFMF